MIRPAPGGRSDRPELEELRALTIRQPWAWCVARGLKPVENRGRLVRWRGLVAVHAGLRWSRLGSSDPRVRAAVAGHSGVADPEELRAGRADQDAPTLFVVGAVIAVAELVDCHAAAGCCLPWGESTYDGDAAYHLVLTGARELRRPIPMSGRIGLWRLPPARANEVRELLAPAV